MTNLKKTFKQKSKLFLAILCLLGIMFSYSCQCKSSEDPRDPRDGTPTPEKPNLSVEISK